MATTFITTKLTVEDFDLLRAALRERVSQLRVDVRNGRFSGVDGITLRREANEIEGLLKRIEGKTR